jgi:hypothetical protein
MTVLVKLLESISFGGKGAVAAHTILSTWQTQEPLMESRPQTIATGHAQAWNELAALPQGPAIFMAREGASRQLIQKVTGEKSEIPLPALLRQQLDKAITTTNWERCQKLLAVDQLMTLLPSDEHPEWSTMINAFELADTTTTQKEVAEARMRYLQILSSSCSDAAGPVAARLLKALPAP